MGEGLVRFGHTVHLIFLLNSIAFVLGGGYLGVTKVWPKVRDKFQSAEKVVAAPFRHALPLQLDPGLSELEKVEVGNLLTNVPNAVLLQAAAVAYQAKNFPIASQVLAARAKALGG